MKTNGPSTALTEVQNELLIFLRPEASRDISNCLLEVVRLALYDNCRRLTQEEKDCLFMAETLALLIRDIK